MLRKLSIFSAILLFPLLLTLSSGSQAATSELRFVLQPDKPNPDPNQQVTATVYAIPPTGTDIKIVSAYISYSPSLIANLTTAPGNDPHFSDWGIHTARIDNTQAVIQLMASDLASGSTSALSEPAALGTFSFTWLGSAQTAFSLITGPATSGAYNSNLNPIPVVADPLYIPQNTTVASRPTPTLVPPGPATQECDACGKCIGEEVPPDWEDCNQCHLAGGRWTILGCVDPSPGGFVQNLLQIIFSVTGGISFLALLYGAFLILTSRGNAEQLQQGKSVLIGAVSGLLLVLFSVFILEFIGITVFGLPGFG